MGILVFAGFLSVFLVYESSSWKKFFAKGIYSIIGDKKDILVNSFREFVPQIRILMTKYLTLMTVPAIILTISTILSQKSVAVSVDMFHKAPSEGSMMLLYAAVGAILGNILTLKATAHRWTYFAIGIWLYALLALAYPFFLGSYVIIIVMTFIAGVLFGVTINLTEGYLFYRFAIDNHKEYGSAVYGIILSVIIFIMMFLADTLQKQVGFISVFVFLSAVLGISGIAMMYDARKNWLNKTDI